jgi:hypothetical protein
VTRDTLVTTVSHTLVSVQDTVTIAQVQTLIDATSA